MSEADVNRVKDDVKREFNRRKKSEKELKLSHVYNDVARRMGFRDWNTYCAHVKES